MDDENQVIQTITADLSAALKTNVDVKLFKADEKNDFTVFPKEQCIDDLPCECNVYSPDSSLLNVTQTATEEVCHSHLLKTNCPITGQPDWATVQIGYKGRFSIDKTSLLRYLVSYREHGDYHEACCEQIFKALYEILKPEYLSVKCFFTRRGGIDINPCRFFGISPDKDFSTHLWRQ
jgi:7-cyano-7-deazaguanine reductase